MAQVDPTRHTIVKARRCFVWNDLYYQIDDYQSPVKNITLLEVFVPTGSRTPEKDDDDDDTFLPPFIKALGPCKNVTGQIEYSMFSLAQKHQ